MTWESSQSSVASISPTGKLSAKSAGEAIITANVGELSASMTVTVYIPATDFQLSASEVWLSTDELLPLEIVSYTPEGGGAIITWTISNPNLAMVEQTGLVTTYQPDDVTITATTETGISQSCLVHICEPVQSIEVPSTCVVRPGETIQLTANVVSGDVSYENKLVTFTSSDESILTVNSDGVVSGKTGGFATVTVAAHNGVSASVSIAVMDIILPAETREIGAEAFAGVKDKLIYIPVSVTSIAEDAFDSSVTILCSADSYAAERCEALGLQVILCQ